MEQVEISLTQDTFKYFRKPTYIRGVLIIQVSLYIIIEIIIENIDHCLICQQNDLLNS